MRKNIKEREKKGTEKCFTMTANRSIKSSSCATKMKTPNASLHGFIRILHVGGNHQQLIPHSSIKLRPAPVKLHHISQAQIFDLQTKD